MTATESLDNSPVPSPSPAPALNDPDLAPEPPSDSNPSGVPDHPTGATGPRTAVGKAISSRNALRHGLFSALAVIPGVESAQEWDDFLLAYVRALMPDDAVERTLADRAALLTWRLQRLAHYDTAAAARAEDAAGDAEQALDRDLDRIIRYEAHLTRQLQSTLERLAVLQKPRRHEVEAFRGGRPSRTYAPASLNWNSPPSRP